MKLKKQLLLQKMGKVFVAYDNENSTLYEFNEVGFFILEKIKQGLSKEQVIKIITEEFGVKKEKARSDCTNFIKKIKKLGLVN